jgi:hypothetical protein
VNGIRDRTGSQSSRSAKELSLLAATRHAATLFKKPPDSHDAALGRRSALRGAQHGSESALTQNASTASIGRDRSRAAAAPEPKRGRAKRGGGILWQASASSCRRSVPNRAATDSPRSAPARGYEGMTPENSLAHHRRAQKARGLEMGAADVDEQLGVATLVGG